MVVSIFVTLLKLLFCLIYIALPPTLTALSHPSCAGTAALTGCPPDGGGLLTFTGTNFVGPASTISMNPTVCNGGITIVSPTLLTCVLQGGSGTTNNIVLTTNGGTTIADTGFTIYYGMYSVLLTH